MVFTIRSEPYWDWVTGLDRATGALVRCDPSGTRENVSLLRCVSLGLFEIRKEGIERPFRAPESGRQGVVFLPTRSLER